MKQSKIYLGIQEIRWVIRNSLKHIESSSASGLYNLYRRSDRQQQQ